MGLFDKKGKKNGEKETKSNSTEPGTTEQNKTSVQTTEKIPRQLLEALKRDGTFKYNPLTDSWTCEITNEKMLRMMQ